MFAVAQKCFGMTNMNHILLIWIFVRLYTYTDKHGKDHAKPLTAWTQKGRRLIYDILRENDVLPLIEREDIA